MLSILIPAYNFDIRALVQDLHTQASACEVAFEIRVYDDCSFPGYRKENQSIASLENVVYEELPENLGRSKIRNKLAAEAKYESLLFMDCDSKTTDDNYIKNYLDAFEANAVIYGGRSYEAEPPAEHSKYLRWYYGVERESMTAVQRQRKPYTNFMTNNFLIPKSIFLAIGLNEDLVGYGHEDTLFGLGLREQRVTIKHIDNALYHIGLEDAIEFLEKTKEGLRNLYFLIEQGKMSRSVKLYRYYRRMKRLGMTKAMLKSFQKNEQKIIRNLTSKSPNLKRFDFFKLGHLLQLDDQRKSA